VTFRWRGVNAQACVLVCTLGLLAAAAILTFHPRTAPPGVPAAAASPSPSRSPARFTASRVRLKHSGFLSWAVLDRRTHEIVGADVTANSDTMSMVKVWLAADYLTHTAPEPTAGMLTQLRRMIVDSDNAVATKVFGLNGGIVTIERMVSVCGLHESRPNYRENRWSPTVVSARDTVLLGDCIASGVAAGPKWTKWLLQQMRDVRGEGDFGPRLAVAKSLRSQIAIKNGWFQRPEDGLWHLACLAVAPDWIISVLQRYPARLGLDYGKKACQEVAAQVLGGDRSA
jgi:hypothetical protein